jgi:hypothetical protein
MLVFGLDGRTSARTSNPDARSTPATAEPTKPLAPVTSVKPEEPISHTNDQKPYMQALCLPQSFAAVGVIGLLTLFSTQ